MNEQSPTLMNLTDLLIPTYRQMLRTLSGLLDKASAQLPAPQADALMSARLAPDMFPLAAQLRFAAYQAQEPVFRLRGEPVPAGLAEILAEARDSSERPRSISETKARIEEALSALEGVDSNALDSAADRPIALDLPNGMVFDLTGDQYARDWALPQFYFHVVAAYAILRHHGVELGKADYVPHMFPYLRPGTMPQA